MNHFFFKIFFVFCFLCSLHKTCAHKHQPTILTRSQKKKFSYANFHEKKLFILIKTKKKRLKIKRILKHIAQNRPLSHDNIDFLKKCLDKEYRNQLNQTNQKKAELLRVAQLIDRKNHIALTTKNHSEREEALQDIVTLLYHYPDPAFYERIERQRLINQRNQNIGHGMFEA